MTVVSPRPRPSGDPDTLLQLLTSGACDHVTILCDNNGEVRINTFLLAALHTLTRSVRHLSHLQNFDQL